MRAQLSNSIYGILDYLVQPLAMLLAAAPLLHSLGVAQYGLWLIASAAAGVGSIVSSGFGDAVIQRIALLRGSDDLPAIRRVIANMLTINLALSCALAGLLWLAIPMAVSRITHADPSASRDCFWALRVGAILIVVRSIESVFISAQRAYERYGPAVRISIVTRLLAIAFSVALATRGFGVVAIMVATLIGSLLGMAAQARALGRHLGRGSFTPAFDRETMLQLSSVGGFTWLQAVSGVIFGQADRLIVGAALGSSAVAYYGVVVQCAQPIHGLTAAGLHFVFPHLAARFASGSLDSVRQYLPRVLLVNILCAAGIATAVMLLGPALLRHWMGHEFASQVTPLLPLACFGYALLALNVTAHYTLMARAQIRLVTAANVTGGLLMLLAMALLIPTHGVQGAVLARLCYAPLTLLLNIPLLRLMRRPVAASIPLHRVALEEA